MRGWRCFDTRRPAGIYAGMANQSAPVCLDSSALPPSSSSVSLPLSIRSSWNVAWSRTTSRVLSARLSFFFPFSLIPLYLCGSTLVSSRLLKNLKLDTNESCEVVVSPPLEKKKKQERKRERKRKKKSLTAFASSLQERFLGSLVRERMQNGAHRCIPYKMLVWSCIYLRHFGSATERNSE